MLYCMVTISTCPLSFVTTFYVPFRVPSYKICLPYTCSSQVISLGATFPDGVSGQVSRPIGQVTIFQSLSRVPLSSAPTKLAEPADPINDLLYGGPTDIPIPLPRPTVSTNIPLSSTFVPPPRTDSILDSISILDDPLVVLIGQMSVLIEQKARIMAKITWLRAASEHHTAKFATLRGVIAYVQCGIRWMREHWDYDSDDESDDAD